MSLAHLYPAAMLLVLICIILRAVHVFILRRAVENQVLRDSGVPKPINPQAPQPEIDALSESLDADIFRGEFLSRDGTHWLQYILVLNRKNRASTNVLVFCQGRMTVIEEGFHFLPLLMRARHHVLLFNYRGVGTPGRATLKSVCQDGIDAFYFGLKVVSLLMSGHWGAPSDNQQILPGAIEKTGVLGYSLGGFVAPQVAHEWFIKNNIKGGVLALMDTGADMYRVLIRRAWYVRLFVPSWLLSPRLNNLAVVNSPYPRLKIFAHGRLDDNTYTGKDEHGNPKPSFGFPIADGHQLYKAAPGVPEVDKQFFEFPCSTHIDMDITDKWTLLNFFQAIYLALESRALLSRSGAGRVKP